MPYAKRNENQRKAQPNRFPPAIRRGKKRNAFSTKDSSQTERWSFDRFDA